MIPRYNTEDPASRVIFSLYTLRLYWSRPRYDTVCRNYYASPFWHLPTIYRNRTGTLRPNTPENTISLVMHVDFRAWVLYNPLIIPLANRSYRKSTAGHSTACNQPYIGSRTSVHFVESGLKNDDRYIVPNARKKRTPVFWTERNLALRDALLI